MTMIDSLAISVPLLISIFGLVISFLTYRLKKKDSDKKDSQDEEQHRSEVSLKLVAIEKDVQYIRLAVDKFEKRGDDHEKRIQSLEKTCRKMKGAK